MEKRFCIKDLLSLVIALSMIVSAMASSAFAVISGREVPFADVPESAWYFENVKYVSENGIMKGTERGLFEPEATMSRAMSITVLYRMAGEPEAGGVNLPFGDVASDKWYTDAVRWAYESGITTGKTETSFAPNDKITRGEFAVLLLRYSEYAELALPEVRSGNVADETNTPFYARTAARVMYRARVINGREGYRFVSQAKIMRAEAAAIIDRFIAAAVPKSSVVEPEVPEYDPELYTDVVFIGNSFTFSGNMPGQFHSIASDKLVRVWSHAKVFYSLQSHYNWFSDESHMDDLNDIVENADIVVLQEFGGFFPDEVYAEKLMDLFGRDKEYYAIMPFVGPATDSRNDGMTLPSGVGGTEGFVKSKQMYIDEHGIYLVYLSNMVNFDAKLGLRYEDFMSSDHHPNDLMGYCMALAMYCTIFDEKASEQNDGDLSLYMIPGKSEADKEEYVKLLKNTVQRILDIQK